MLFSICRLNRPRARACNGNKRVKRAHGHKVADIKLTVLSGSF